jgi:hypothetical protein
MKMKIKIESSTLAKLGLMADRNGLEPGECIEALLTFASSGHWFESDPFFMDRFTGLLEEAIENSRPGLSGWGAGHPMVKIKDDGKADMRELQERIRQYEAGELD